LLRADRASKFFDTWNYGATEVADKGGTAFANRNTRLQRSCSTRWHGMRTRVSTTGDGSAPRN